jgi:hypothetical protein
MARRRFQFSQRGFGDGSIGRIDERCNTGGCRHQLAQKSQLFRRQFNIEKIDTR